MEALTRQDTLRDALQQSDYAQEQYRLLLEHMLEAFALQEVLTDQPGEIKDCRFLEINPAFEEVTGLNRESVVGKTVAQIFPRSDDWLTVCGQVASTGKARKFEYYFDGLGKLFEVKAYLMPHVEHARHAPQVATILVDSEVQLSKQLQESQALFRISQMLMGAIDLPATLQQIAEAASALLRASNRTILHLVDESGNYLHAVAVSGVRPSSMEKRMNFKLGEGVAGLALATGETINILDVMDDARYVHPPSDSTNFLRSLLVAPVKIGDRSLGTLSVQSPQLAAFSEDDARMLTTLGAQAALAIEKARLLSDLQTSLEHEKAARAQLVQSEKLAALGRIVASVAHELNNPLQAIQNALYLIQMDENLSLQAHDDLNTVIMETNRMTDLIARLKETYRPTVKEEFQPGSLNQLVLEVQKLLGTYLRHNHVKFEFYPVEALPDIQFIRDQIKQVILNISLNAVEAMPEGGILVIRTRFDPLADSVVMSISDTGPSINPKILPYIFDPFITTKEGGTGLGLAITYDIVRRHNGRIEVETASEKGTTFHVWLPTRQGFESE